MLGNSLKKKRLIVNHMIIYCEDRANLARDVFINETSGVLKKSPSVPKRSRKMDFPTTPSVAPCHFLYLLPKEYVSSPKSHKQVISHLCASVLCRRAEINNCSFLFQITTITTKKGCVVGLV